MSAQPLDELFVGHAGPWTEQELRVDLDLTDAALDATSYSLTSEGVVVSARAVGRRLVADEPFPADLDLAALATATRYPGP